MLVSRGWKERERGTNCMHAIHSFIRGSCTSHIFASPSHTPVVRVHVYVAGSTWKIKYANFLFSSQKIEFSTAWFLLCSGQQPGCKGMWKKQESMSERLDTFLFNFVVAALLLSTLCFRFIQQVHSMSCRVHRYFFFMRFHTQANIVTMFMLFTAPCIRKFITFEFTLLLRRETSSQFVFIPDFSHFFLSPSYLVHVLKWRFFHSTFHSFPPKRHEIRCCFCSFCCFCASVFSLTSL